MKLKYARYAAWISALFVAGTTILFLLSAAIDGIITNVLLVLLIILCAVYVVIVFKFYRCPHCGRRIRVELFKEKETKFCASCGEELDWD